MTFKNYAQMYVAFGEQGVVEFYFVLIVKSGL